MNARQPKGIPIGGQYAANSHDEAATALSHGQYRLPNGWVSTPSESSKDDRVVCNPDGSAFYRIKTRRKGEYRGDVYCTVTDLATGKTEAYRGIAPWKEGIDALYEKGHIPIHHAPPPGEVLLIKDSLWTKHSDDQSFVDSLVVDSLSQVEENRTAKPFSAKHIRPGDCIDFTPILEDKDTYPEASENHHLLRSAEMEAFVVEDVEHRDNGVIVSTNMTNWYFPDDYKVTVIGVDENYKTGREYLFPGEEYAR